MTTASRSAFWPAVALVALLGVVLRAIHVALFYYSPVVDMSTYLAYGELYLLGPLEGEFLYLTTSNPPAYPVLTGVVRYLFGWENLRAILWFQVLVDAATTTLLAAVGRRLYGDRAGLMAAVIFALYRVSILHTGQIMTETTAFCMVVLAILLFLRAMERPAVPRLVLAGVAAAAAGYFRLNVLSMLFAFCGYMWLFLWNQRGWTLRNGLRAFVPPFILGICAIATLLPWGVRNSLILQEPVLFNGGNAVRYLVGANPKSRGEFIPEADFPEEWKARLGPTRPGMGLEERKARDLAAQELAHEFLFKTHTAYYLFTLLPNKFMGFLWSEPWNFTGQGNYAAMKLPFGPRIRIPLFGFTFVVTVGLLGLFMRSRRYPGFPAILWLALFLPVLFLPIDPRYRYMSSGVLMVSAGAVLARLLFAENFGRRLGIAVAVWAAIAVAWTAAAAALYSGPNLFERHAARHQDEDLLALAGSGKTFEISPGSGDRLTTDILSVPVNPGLMSHLAVSMRITAIRPPNKADNYRSWGEAWPQAQFRAAFVDATSQPLGSVTFPHAAVGNYLPPDAPIWQVLEVPGTATTMTMALIAERPGMVTISGLSARGGVWLKDIPIENEPTTSSAVANPAPPDG